MSALPKDSLVLVTGANGFIAGHIVDQLIQNGYRVRGTVRSESKAQWLKDYVKAKYGADRLEIAIVPDMSAPESFDEAVKGTSAFLHVASDLSFSNDPDVVIPTVIKGAEAALKAAQKEPGMKRFVYTSSTAAAFIFEPGVPRKVTLDDYSDDQGAVELAHKEGPAQALHVYTASKSKGEKAVFNFAKEHKPGFTVNAVVPNFNMGPLLAPEVERQHSSGGAVPLVYQTGWEHMALFDSLGHQHHIDVRDTARLHVAPLLDGSLQNRRLFAAVEPFTWDDLLAVLKKLRPNQKLPEPRGEKLNDLHDMSGPKEQSEEILRKLFGRDGFIPFEESVAANLSHLE